MVAGGDSFSVEHPGRLLGPWSPLQTPSGTLLLLAARDDLLVPDTARWHALCLYGMCSPGFFQDGSPPILFGHLKNDSFLIRSKILCTGSLNTTLIPSICTPSSCILKSFFGLAGTTPCRDLSSNGAFPQFYSRSSSRRLYSSMRLMSCLIS